MTGNLFLDLLISLAGIAVLVGISWALGGWRSVAVDEASAHDRLAFDEPDFDAGDWLFSEDGKAAIAISSSDEEAAFIFAVGDGLAVRRMPKAAVSAEAEGEHLMIRLGDVSKRRLRLVAPDRDSAARWAGLLGGKGYI